METSLEDETPPSIMIPITTEDGENDFLEVFVDELDKDPEDLIEVMREQRVPLEIWFQIAMAYYNQKQYKNMSFVVAITDRGNRTPENVIID